MATATPGILINSIRGRIGNLVFYCRRRAVDGARTQCVLAHVIPHNPDTEAQRTVRRTFAEAVLSWQFMTTDEKYAFIRKARSLNMSGYNLFISKYMKTKISGTKSAGSAVLPSLAERSQEVYPERSRGIPSVSEPYIKAYRINRHIFHPETDYG